MNTAQSNTQNVENRKLQKLIQYLDTVQSKIQLEPLGALLASLDVTIEDVSQFTTFDDAGYKRNLVRSSDWYDLLVMCWRPGQCSSIHDHGGSSCGFKILAGEGAESVFERVNPNIQECDLVKKVGDRSYPLNHLCLARDADIHRIENRSASTDLVTLHIYTPPLHMKYYREC